MRKSSRKGLADGCSRGKSCYVSTVWVYASDVHASLSILTLRREAQAVLCAYSSKVERADIARSVKPVLVRRLPRAFASQIRRFFGNLLGLWYAHPAKWKGPILHTASNLSLLIQQRLPRAFASQINCFFGNLLVWWMVFLWQCARWPLAL
jgi:hypothetical protein